MRQTALVLQGGAALGAYELGAVKRLYREPEFPPAIVSGSSIGAVNASVLVGAKGDPVETLQELWRRFTIPASGLVPNVTQELMSLYGNPHFYRMRCDYFRYACWTSYYWLDPLKETLKDLVDFRKLSDSETRLVLTVTDVESGLIQYFDNHAENENDRITLEAVLASAAFPPGLPMIEYNGRQYWDGGLVSNTPLSPVIERLDSSGEGEPQIFVINCFPGEGTIPKTMADVVDRIVEIMFSSRIRFDVKTLKKINEFVEVMQAIDSELPEDSPIRQKDGYKRLLQYMKLKEPVVIKNLYPEPVSGAIDFSGKSIERRIENGFRDAEEALRGRSAT